MDVREKLVDFIESARYCGSNTSEEITENLISNGVTVQAVFYMPVRRRVDLTNLLEALDDVLANSGVLADDHCKIIVSHDGSRVSYDKERPRTEVTIRNYKGALPW